jgi:hypothetical protein
MANDPNSGVNPFDPFSTWRTARDAYMETWSKAMLDLVNTEAYADATSHMLDSYLSVSGPIRKLLETSMTQVLSQFNMPSRNEIISLAERLTNIEMRLDDLDAKLDEMARANPTPQPPPLRGEGEPEAEAKPAAPPATSSRTRRPSARTTK